jgi:hypothetical protein
MTDTGYPPVDVAKELARGEEPAIGAAAVHIPGPPRVELVKKLIVYSALC